MSSQSTAVRFRHSAGDLGPLIFSPSANIQTVKERLLTEWPRDGSMGSDAPSCIADMKLILGGKFLDNSESLEELRATLGDPGEVPVMTMHAVIRPVSAGKNPAKSKEQEVNKGCSCVIC